jgi:hypothetical protein
MTWIFPRNDNMAAIPAISQINANIAQFASGKKVRYVNVNDKLSDRLAESRTANGKQTVKCIRNSSFDDQFACAALQVVGNNWSG